MNRPRIVGGLRRAIEGALLNQAEEMPVDQRRRNPKLGKSKLTKVAEIRLRHSK